MKRILAVVLAFCMLFALAGCQGTCENCGKTAKLTEVTLMGEKGKVCDECKAQIESLSADLESLASELENLQ